MATYPIVRNRMSMPGTSGGTRANIDFSTGEAEVWEQIGRLGATIADVGQKFYIQQAEVQLMDSIGQAEDEMLNLADRLRTNTDENTYQRELDKSVATMNRFRPKNGMAAQGFDKWIKNQQPNWRQDVEKSKQIRLDNKYHALTDTLKEKAERTYSTAELAVHLQSGVMFGRINENQAGDILRETNNIVNYNRGMNTAKVQGEKVLDSVYVDDEGNKRIKMMPELTDPGQIMAVINLAKSSIDDAKIEAGRIKLETTAKLKKYAADPNVNSDVMEEKIRQSDALTPEQKITAMREFSQARNIMAKGGSNPYTTTENWELYRQDRIRALNEELTEQEVIDHVGVKGYAWPQADKLISLINGKSSKAKDFEDSSSAKLLAEMVEDWGKVAYEGEEYKVNMLREKGYRLLQDAIDTAEKPLTDREKKETALRIFNNLRLEAPGMTIEPEFLITPEEKAKRNQYFTSMRLAPGEFGGIEKIPQPKTKEEYDALPKGAVYIHPTLGKVVKQ